MFSLKGKNIIITGASSGIGRDFAISASKMEANLILIGRSPDRLKKTFDLLNQGKHFFFSYNLTDIQGIEGLISNIVTEVGKIDGFVHSAGIELTKPLQSIKMEDYTEIYTTNVFSALEIAKHITKKKNINPDGGSIVFISSVMGITGESGKIAYSSSKSAIIGACKSMAIELAAKKIRVNCVLPGVVNTEMIDNMFSSLPESSVIEIKNKHPLGLGEPSDVSNVILFLISDASRWITGTNIIVDGGYSAR
jgi:NAD(P)-dependent dehydrogenase (short-subunit alcohol dehydrogenase family)